MGPPGVCTNCSSSSAGACGHQHQRFLLLSHGACQSRSECSERRLLAGVHKAHFAAACHLTLDACARAVPGNAAGCFTAPIEAWMRQPKRFSHLVSARMDVGRRAGEDGGRGAAPGRNLLGGQRGQARVARHLAARRVHCVVCQALQARCIPSMRRSRQKIEASACWRAQ